MKTFIRIKLSAVCTLLLVLTSAFGQGAKTQFKEDLINSKSLKAFVDSLILAERPLLKKIG